MAPTAMIGSSEYIRVVSSGVLAVTGLFVAGVTKGSDLKGKEHQGLHELGRGGIYHPYKCR